MIGPVMGWCQPTAVTLTVTVGCVNGVVQVSPGSAAGELVVVTGSGGASDQGPRWRALMSDRGVRAELSSGAAALMCPDLDHRRPLRGQARVRSCLCRSDRIFGCQEHAGRTSLTLSIRRSSARRRPQRAVRLGVLPQNGAGDEQWCAAALGQVGAGERAEV
jgi:hypothetical protein